MNHAETLINGMCQVLGGSKISGHTRRQDRL